MKRCEVCHKLTDNGTKRCQHCGSPFKYDPRVTPYSETKILLAILVVVVIGWIISNAIPQKLPDPAECSLVSYRRFRSIARDYHRQSRNALRAELMMTRELSELMSYKYEAQSLPVPDCLEPAKTELVAYLNQVYYVARYSMWMDYQSAAVSTQRAGYHWEALNAHLEEVKACIPNCP